MAAKRSAPARSRQVKLFLFLCALPMLLVFPYLGAVNNPNENVRTYMTIAIVEKGTIRIDDILKTFGWVNDMARVPQPDGSAYFYSVKAPATSFAGVPGYWLYSKVVAPLFGKHYPADNAPIVERQTWLRNATWACRLFAVQIPCFLFLLWFERYLRAFTHDRVLRLSAVAAACLGTNYLAYTHMFASHATFAIAAFGCFAVCEQELRKSRGVATNRRLSRAFLAGLFAGWCVSLEYHALPLAVVLSVWALVTFYRPTRLLAFGAGGAIHAAMVMLFQWKAYGNPFTPGHKMVENQAFAAEHHQGLFGIVMPKLDSIASLAFDRGFGFFGTSPFMALGLLALPLVIVFTGARGSSRERRLRRWGAIVWMVAMVGLVGANAGFLHWRGGWTVGPRYLGAAPPFFAFGAVLALERLIGLSRTRRAIVGGLAGGLALASVLSIGTVGIVYDTLPESVQRPFAQFSFPMIRTAFVPHHVGEWFGLEAAWFWYVAGAGLVGATLLAALVYDFGRFGIGRTIGRFVAFAAALAIGMVPALTPTADLSPLFVLHRDCRGFTQAWEPPGRDRISLLRIEAERYGPRRPCNWYHLADLERVIGEDFQALRDESRAQGFDRDRCPKLRF